MIESLLVGFGSVTAVLVCGGILTWIACWLLKKFGEGTCFTVLMIVLFFAIGAGLSAAHYGDTQRKSKINSKIDQAVDAAVELGRTIEERKCD